MLMSEFVPGQLFRGLFVGRPKTGKTIAAASWAEQEDAKILIIDLDRRIAPIYRFYPKYLDKIRVEPFNSNEYEKLFRFLESLQDKCPYTCVIFDGLTMLAEHLINYMIGLRGGPQGDKGKKKGIIELAGVEDFGGEARGLSQILLILTNLPCHFIMTAHYIVVENTNVMTNKTTITKQIVTAGKKVAARVPINFDEIYFFDAKSSMVPSEAPIYIAKTQNDGEGFAGTALDLPPEIDVTMKPGSKGLYTKLQEYMKIAREKTEKEGKVIGL